ncbi:MAG: response regulator transcription factor [Chitinophagaceae bacterium]|nr:response regulator transcription factor [Chitinophagaceae bacterium]MBP6214766.1 response regulator transcription factor [Chitinophagaceae bacterium]
MFTLPIKIIIVEDEPLIAEGIALHLKNSIFSVSAIAYDADEALQLLQTKTPDIAILDINLEGGKDGIQIAEYINKVCPMPFIYLTSYSDKAIMDRAKATSPSGFIVKPFNKNTLLASLEIAVSNFSQHSNNHVPQLSLGKINKFLPDPLSEREYEILQLLYEGKSNQEICDMLFIAMNTVKRHVTNTYFKLDVKSRTEAITQIRNLMLK